MNTRQKTQGSALIVVIIFIVIAALGVLGYALWQRLNDTPEPTANSGQTQEVDEGNPTYDGPGYTFDFPLEGWTLEEITPEFQDENPKTPSSYPQVTTDDFSQTTIAPNRGASITVQITEGLDTIDQELARIQEMASTFNLKDLKKQEYPGGVAITYNSDYEGNRYHTAFLRDGLLYDIVLNYAFEEEYTAFAEAYMLAVSTFRFSS